MALSANDASGNVQCSWGVQDLALAGTQKPEHTARSDDDWHHRRHSAPNECASSSIGNQWGRPGAPGKQRGPLDLNELALVTALPIERLTEALEKLIQNGLLTTEASAGKTRYSSTGCVLR